MIKCCNHVWRSLFIDFRIKQHGPTIKDCFSVLMFALVLLLTWLIARKKGGQLYWWQILNWIYNHPMYYLDKGGNWKINAEAGASNKDSYNFWYACYLVIQVIVREVSLIVVLIFHLAGPCALQFLHPQSTKTSWNNMIKSNIYIQIKVEWHSARHQQMRPTQLVHSCVGVGIVT